MYYISLDKKTKKGPYGEDEIQQRFSQGQFTETTLIWKEGMDDWVSLKQCFPHFFDQNEPPSDMPPPPHNKEAIYYIHSQLGQKGPLTYNELKKLFQLKEISAQALVWKEGMSEWAPLNTIIDTSTRDELIYKLANTIAHYVGLEEVMNFSLKDFMSKIFIKHKESEIVDFFCVGGSKTTPDLSHIPVIWPSPWIFTRILILSLVLYFGFNWITVEFENTKTIPGLLFAGNFAIPFSFLVLFAELNLRQNVPWYFLIKILLGGGLLSLIFTLILAHHTHINEAYLAGPIEELAKLLAVIIFTRKYYLNDQILTGLLCGAAVGTGFAIFESAGYVFENLGLLIAEIASGSRISSLDPDKVMRLRALLSPFCHIIWTAITAAAFWRVKGNAPFNFRLFFKPDFLKIAIIPVLLHMFWNSSYMIDDNKYYLKVIICGVIGWILILLLVNEGINQLLNEKMKQKNSA